MFSNQVVPILGFGVLFQRKCCIRISCLIFFKDSKKVSEKATEFLVKIEVAFQNKIYNNYLLVIFR